MAGSKVLDAATKGAFVSWFTKGGYSCSIYPALDIYKIKWSFFKISDKQAAFDIYMEVPTFLALTRSIKDGSLKKRIAAEAAQKAAYPGAWQSGPMGANGANSIAIGANKKGDGITLNGRSGKNNAFIPLPSFSDLEDLAIIADAVIAMWKEPSPVPGITGWYKDRANIILSASSKFKHKEPEEVEEETTEEVAKVVEEKVEQTPTPKTTEKAAKVEMHTLGPVKKQGNVWYLPVRLADNTQKSLCFKDGVFCSNWDTFKEKASDGITVSLNCIMQGDQLWYTGA